MSDEIKIEMPPEAKDLPALVRAVDAAKPKQADVAALVDYFRANPKICDALGNLAQMATLQVAQRSFNVTSVRLAILTRLEQMRDELGYQTASELEKSLIQHIILCWLRLHDAEMRYSMAQANSPTKLPNLHIGNAN